MTKLKQLFCKHNYHNQLRTTAGMTEVDLKECSKCHKIKWIKE